MKQIIRALLLTIISFSFVGCAYHTTRSYSFGEPVVISASPFYRAVTHRKMVNPHYSRVDLRPDFPPYRADTPNVYFCY